MRQFLSRLGLVLGFVLLMIAGAYVDVPMHPVPMTLQSLFILLAGLVLGPKDGFLAVVAYLLAAVTGLPVLSGGASGLEPFTGPTAGYLYVFAPVAFMAGRLTQRITPRSLMIWGPLLFSLHILLLGAGTAWLARELGWPTALAHGFTPFLLGAAVKSVMAWALWQAASKLKRGGTG